MNAAVCGNHVAIHTGGNDPGSGTGTIGVSAHIAATPKMPDAQRADEFDVAFEVSLTDVNDRPIDSGSVSITSAAGRTDLTFSNQEWLGGTAGYDQTYTLEVEVGAGSVFGVMVDGPDVHRITSPADGSTVVANTPQTIAWDRDEPAQEVDVESTTPFYPLATLVHDDGSVDVNVVESFGPDAIDVSRANSVDLAGATAGSKMEVRIDNWVDVTVF